MMTDSFVFTTVSGEAVSAKPKLSTLPISVPISATMTMTRTETKVLLSSPTMSPPPDVLGIAAVSSSTITTVGKSKKKWRAAPREWSDIVGHDDIVQQCKDMLNRDAPRNMIFYGPPGVGKTALARVFILTFLQNASCRAYVTARWKETQSSHRRRIRAATTITATTTNNERTDLAGSIPTVESKIVLPFIAATAEDINVPTTVHRLPLLPDHKKRKAIPRPSETEIERMLWESFVLEVKPQGSGVSGGKTRKGGGVESSCGIQYVHDRVIPFLSERPPDHFLRKGSAACTGSSVERRMWKWVLIDNAEDVTHEAQQALRLPIENNDHVRFLIICNELTSTIVIDPIQSRCAPHMRFRPFLWTQIRDHLLSAAHYYAPSYFHDDVVDPSVITKQQQRQQREERIAFVSKNARGDLRQALVVVSSIFFPSRTVSLHHHATTPATMATHFGNLVLTRCLQGRLWDDRDTDKDISPSRTLRQSHTIEKPSIASPRPIHSRDRLGGDVNGDGRSKEDRRDHRAQTKEDGEKPEMVLGAFSYARRFWKAGYRTSEFIEHVLTFVQEPDRLTPVQRLTIIKVLTQCKLEMCTDRAAPPLAIEQLFGLVATLFLLLRPA